MKERWVQSCVGDFLSALGFKTPSDSFILPRSCFGEFIVCWPMAARSPSVTVIYMTLGDGCG